MKMIPVYENTTNEEIVAALGSTDKALVDCDLGIRDLLDRVCKQELETVVLRATVDGLYKVAVVLLFLGGITACSVAYLGAIVQGWL